MQAGEWYDANSDSELLALRERAEALNFAFNHMPRPAPRLTLGTKSAIYRSYLCPFT